MTEENKNENRIDYEKIGRLFVEKSKAKTTEGALNIIKHVPIFNQK